METTTRAFPIILAAGVLFALTWSALSGSRPSGPGTAHSAVDSGLVALAGGLIAARVGFVFLHWGYYASKPLQGLAIWEGGMTGWAAPIGAVGALLLYSRATGISLWALGDHLAGPATLLVFASWAGCLLDGCAYGMTLPAASRAPVSPDLLGNLAPRWPTQTIAAVATAASLVPIFWLRRLQAGAAAAGAVALQAIIAWGISQFRADPVAVFGLHRSDSLGWAAIGLITGLLLLHRLNAREA